MEYRAWRGWRNLSRGGTSLSHERDGVAGGLSDDRSLLERIRRGDTGGAEELFERYAPALLRFASRMVSDHETAEEVTQEVFVKVICRAHQYDGRAVVSSGLFAIVQYSRRLRTSD